MKKSKKNKVNYNFPKETCELIAERDGNECLFCKMQYHMDKCRSEMLLGIPDIMHYINKSQGGLRFVGVIGNLLNGVSMENLHKVLLQYLPLEHKTIRKRNNVFWMAIMRWWSGYSLHRLSFMAEYQMNARKILYT